MDISRFVGRASSDDFAVIFVSYRSWAETIGAADRFYADPRVSRIVVIDNSPGSREERDSAWMTNRLDKFVFVSALDNTGYGGGNNLAVEILRSSGFQGYIVVSNNDVSISLECLAVARQTFGAVEELGQLFFRTCNEDGKLMYSSIKMDGLKQEWVTHDVQDGQAIIPADYAAGSFFITTMQVIEAAGRLFDERYFMYWEEVDLSYRLRQLGYTIYCSQSPTLTRKGNSAAARSKAEYYMVRNSFLFSTKFNISAGSHLHYVVDRLIRTLAMSIRMRTFAPFRCAMAGLLDGLRTNVVGPRHMEVKQ